eukprot:1155078-Pelagomonas_calceolata.AAC.6
MLLLSNLGLFVKYLALVFGLEHAIKAHMCKERYAAMWACCNQQSGGAHDKMCCLCLPPQAGL